MNAKLINAMIGASSNKDCGMHANMGQHYANFKRHKQYLRKNHLGKFAKGRK